MAIITRETDYALRALTGLALADDFLPVSTLAEQEEVPPDFLRKIMQRLHQAGIVESSQGPFGGYRLARSARRLSVLDVVETVQGPLVMSECISRPEICGRIDYCPFRRRLSALGAGLNAKLAKVRISDAANEIQSAREAAK
ncbi:MAG: Rrf2 family transcriptional regulator [Candidatus Brocadiae bacterium]|nr:Rrf2 family transcriptional regulator [Candidatus Brocadiia bacterium]